MLKESDYYMLDDEICEKRNQLNKSILEGQEYEITYKVSLELDELIAKYYRNTNENSQKRKAMMF